MPQKLWYQVDNQFADFISPASDASLAALLIPAMHHGEDIIIRGAVSENLLFQANNDLQAIYRIFHPHLHKINVHADKVYSACEVSSNVATGFSGGMDSFHTLGRHFFDRDVSPGFRITHLLYNNVGSHGKAGQWLWEKRFQRLKLLPEKYNIPFIGVNSNLDQFYPAYSFLQTHTPRDASVGLLLQRGIGKYLYSSSINYPHLNMNPGRPITFADSIVLPKFSSPQIQILSVGSETSRVKKVMEVAGLPDAWQLLDVCTDEKDEGNCSRCFKCMKTQLALDVAGKLENFSNVFDLKTFHSRRLEFISSIHRSRLIHLNEILWAAKENNYKIPARTYFYSYIRYYGLRRRWLSLIDLMKENRDNWFLFMREVFQKVYRHAA